MIGRRGMLAGMVYGAGGLGQPRRDQELRPGPDRRIAPGGAAGTFRGRLVTVFGTGANTGIFVYSGIPATGNLIASITAHAGTDPYGNTYGDGIEVQLTATQHVQIHGAGIDFLNGDFAPSNITEVGNGIWSLIGGLQTNTDLAALIELISAQAGSTAAPGVILGQRGASISRLTNALLEVHGPGALAYSSGLIGNIPATQADHTLITVTAAVATRITKAWSIPANDAKVDTCYRLTAWGFGTEGTTAQNCQFGIGLNGAVVRSMTAAALTVSGNLRWKVEIILHILTTGAGGTADVAMNGDWGTAATPAVTGPIVAASTASGGEPVNTTANNDLELMIAWASATGAPTLTCVGSIFERIGP